MKIDSTFLRSKVARRMFALFVASALVPIGTLALLSFNQVTDQLIENGYRELHRDNKAVAMTVFERLTIAQSELELVGRELPIENTSSSSGPNNRLQNLSKRFRALRIETPDGHKHDLLGRVTGSSNDAMAVVIGPEKSKTAVWSTLGEDHQPHVFMRVAMDAAVITGEIASEFLWNVPLDATSILCVLGESGDPLFCSDTVPSAVLDTIRKELADHQANRLGWQLHGEKFLANYWSLFLEHSFNTSQWTIVLAKPESEVLSAMARFEAMFPPAIAISILAVILLSVSQIRRYLVPLERLSHGTRRIAERNFGDPVQVESGDEFEELAGSFNAMATRLERQFGTLATMAEIDRLILSTTDADYIVETLLNRLPEIVPCRSVYVAIIGEDGETADVRVNRNTTGNVIEPESFVLTGDDVSALTDGARHRFFEADVSIPDYLACITDDQTRRVLVLPVVSKDGLTAIIALGIAPGCELSNEDIDQAREVADRTAVALSNIAWEEKLYHQAHYDALTDLPNRVLLRDRLEQAMTRASREGTSVAALFLDLDRFKSINDSLGHVAGDRFLKEMATRLTGQLREGDTVVRFGGDEFIVIIPDIESDLHIVTAISTICENILAATMEPFSLEGHEIKITSSIGVSLYPQDADNFDDLLKNADTAMYHAKSQGRDNYQFYAQDLNAAAMQRFSMQNDLHGALENDELELFFQPQVDLRSGNLVGAECLIRWQHPERGFVSPSRFIPIAEDTGLITAIDEWVLRTACAQSRIWQDRGLPGMRMAVNLSPRQFHNRALVAMVGDVLKETRLPAELLELEVTEGAIMTDIDQTIATLRALSNLGVRVAVDDFGTGYSSLAYLAQFPLDVLKIDQSFVRDVVTDPDVACVVAAIVSLAHSLGLTVIAEGVEEEEQVNFLRSLNCEEIQGYLYGRPLPAKEFELLLEFGVGDPLRNVGSGTGNRPWASLPRAAGEDG